MNIFFELVPERKSDFLGCLMNLWDFRTVVNLFVKITDTNGIKW